MSRFSQLGRFLRIQTELDADALLLTRLRGREGISALYQFDLEMLAEQPVAFDRVLGQSVRIHLQVPGSARVIAGIVSELSQGDDVSGPEDLGTFIRYHARVVPHFWLLTQRVQSRVWQRQSVPDILRQILHDEWQLDVHLACSGSYRPRNYCVQYRESDFAFVSRLMEEEGIGYCFEHKEAGESLVVSDLWTNRPELAAPATLNYAITGAADQPRIHSWTKTQKVRALKHVLRDHCFQLPSEKIESGMAAAASAAVGQVSHAFAATAPQALEVHDYPCGLTPHYDGINKDGGEQASELPHLFDDVKHWSQVRGQEQVVQGLSIQGASNVGHLEPGRHFSLARHRDGDGKYLLTHVEHDAGLEGAYLTTPEDGKLVYSNHFTAIAAGVPYRPARGTPKPRILGTHTATVVGRTGDEIFCDKYGRIKVRFHWDGASTTPGDDSCWIRVAQPWAGKGFGSVQIPRVGQEVVVDFQDGDPDRPLALGGVYNAEQMPPYNLPNESSHSGFKSRYLGSDQNSSEIRFDDTKGSERLHVASDNDVYMLCGQNHRQDVGQNEFHSVGNTYQINTGTGFHLKVGSGSTEAVSTSSSTPGSGTGGGSSSANWETFWESMGVEIEAPTKTELIWGQNASIIGGMCTLIDGAYFQFDLLFDLVVSPGAVVVFAGYTYEYSLIEHLRSSPNVDTLCTGTMTYTVYGAMTQTSAVSITLDVGGAAYIEMLPACISQTVGDNEITIDTTSIMLGVGLNYISVTSSGISLCVGTVSLKLTDAGITMTVGSQSISLTDALITLSAGSSMELSSTAVTVSTTSLTVG